ncbi:MAG: 2-polyprenyl-3-methyl-6-methoxy-1,4-benzoquinone monooxygenase [Gammaproteobacteria bacterium]|nr:2-polyprenyl-3-methyl-6-methoxy-1,4-benzoquinone monooxygenase [Gammaproteobacteria bacterium]
MRNYSIMDQMCLALDDALRAVQNNPRTTAREYPAARLPEAEMTPVEQKHAAACMRINHAGEVSAQGLYHGQSWTSRSQTLRANFAAAAIEEGDHLAWCTQRLFELGSRKSLLTPFWYAGSFMIGVTAGIAGDRWSLGFLAETETQVMKHLDKHLNEIPNTDQRSHAILKQMQIDEGEHRDHAVEAGAAHLPSPIKKLMQFMSAVMVKTTYWV